MFYIKKIKLVFLLTVTAIVFLVSFVSFSHVFAQTQSFSLGTITSYSRNVIESPWNGGTVDVTTSSASSCPSGSVLVGFNLHNMGDHYSKTNSLYCRSLTFTPITLPNLTASAPIPSTATAGVAQTYTSTISNIGNAPTGASFDNFFQTATLNTGGGGTTVVDLTPPPSLTNLLNGQSRVITSSSLIFTDTTVGKYAIRACADHRNRDDLNTNGAIAESSELNNNCSPWTTVTVTESAKPAPTNVVVTQEVCNGTGAFDASLKISWDKIPNATSYKLYRAPTTPAAENSPVTISQPTSGTKVEFLDKGLASDSGLGYGYRVSAVYGNPPLEQESERTDPVANPTKDCSLPSNESSVSLSCGGTSGCIATYNGSVNLIPVGQGWNSCTTASTPKHTGWNDSASWLVS